MMQEQAGQAEVLMGIQINFVWIPVYDTKCVADALHLNRQYVTQLCEEGKLIATKVSGRWLIHEQEWKGNWVSGIPF